MAVPLRNALRSSNRCLTISSPPLRQLTIFSPAKAQVQPVTQPDSIEYHPPPTPPLDVQSPRPGSWHATQGARQPDAPTSSQAFFDSTGVLWVGVGGDQPPDPNKAKLGKTLRILQDRLPTLLQSPLPQEILAPNISLNLFPSTHPHLPSVSGRVAYRAALWTSPIAWNRVPIIGNVKLEILAERMTSEPLTFLPRRAGAMPEQLVVRWCEKRRCANDSAEPSSIAKSLGLRRGVDAHKAFTGLFIFDFDKEGRILTHTIETASESGNWEKGMGAKFVGLTDWLLGGIRDPGGAPAPMFQRITKS